MKCTILTIGTELLMGQIINTNAVYLSKELNSMGYDVLYHFTVGDNPIRLKSILSSALSMSDIVITTGGLGPTQDDLTKETVAESFSKEMILHEPTLEKIESFFSKINKTMTSNNIKQAYIPKDSLILDNTLGTAPGIIIAENNKIVISLPGPPKEMKNMFTLKVKPFLMKKSKEVISSKVIKFFGMGESSVESHLEDLVSNQTNPTLATYAKAGEVSLRITSKGKSQKDVDEVLAPIIKEIDNRLNEFIYSFDDESLEEVVGKLLIENNITLSLAESCTGGLVASKLTSISGISKSLDRSIVTYSNKAKIKELGIDENILKEFGAVSKETAVAMAKGLKGKTDSDICLSITGIAGPTGGTPTKPVGLVYIGLATNNKVIFNEFNLHGDRSRIRNITSMLALNMIRKTILNNKNI